MSQIWAAAARFSRAGLWVFALGVPFALSAWACGSRTGLFPDGGAGAPSVQSCEIAADCIVVDPCMELACIDTYCQEVGVIECPVLDVCTAGICDSKVGECVYEPVTDDLDGDGFLGPLPGTIAGLPGSCGEDCDDTRPLSFPGGEEVCDGVDNDCDGVVDNGSDYLSTATVDRDLRILSSEEHEYAGSNDLVFGAGTFVGSYWGETDTKRPYIRGIDEVGNDTFGERLVANINSTTLGPDLAFSGMSFGSVLSDSRFTDYELSFARFDPMGQKLGPDLRLTDTPGFSTHERMIFDQGRFVIVWDDHREKAYGGTPRIFSQLVDVDGIPLGGNVPLSESGQYAELPILAATPTRFGLVHTVLVDSAVAIQLRTFDKNFGDPTSVQLVPSGAKVPHITAVGSSFLVTWSLYELLDNGQSRPGPVIRGALVDERGGLLAGPQDLTSGATVTHTHSTLSLGDRALVVWADDLAGNYELYAKVIGLDLQDLEPRTRLTDGDWDSISPFLAVNETGRVGIVFDDKRTSRVKAYFMTVGCEFSERCDCSGCAAGDCPSCCIVK